MTAVRIAGALYADVDSLGNVTINAQPGGPAVKVDHADVPALLWFLVRNGSTGNLRDAIGELQAARFDALIFAAGFNEMGQLRATAHQQDDGTWTIKPDDVADLFRAPDMTVALHELRRMGATFLIAAPRSTALEFIGLVESALGAPSPRPGMVTKPS